MKKILVGIGSLIILGGLAFGGWWQFVREEAKPTPTPPANNTQNTTPSDPSEGGKYLVIKEWGVKFELPTELRGDIQYQIGKYARFTPDVALFESTKFGMNNPSCNIASRPNSVIDLGLGIGLMRVSNSAALPELPSTKISVIGEYTYFSTSSNVSCLTAYNKESSQELTKIRQSLSSSLSTIK